MNLNDLDDSSELDARELAFGEKFQYPTYRGAPRGTISADAEVARYKLLAEKIRPFVVDTIELMHEALSSGKKVMIEGANAAMLDIDFGTYPFVTSSNCTIGGCFTGLGIPHTSIDCVIGVVKSYTTRVGGGPFLTECLNIEASPWYDPRKVGEEAEYHDLIGQHFEKVGHEIGTSTGRTRRCGWLDLALVKFTTRLNGYSCLNLTKLDVMTGIPGGKIRLAIDYKHEGKILNSFPSSLKIMAKCDVVFEEMDGWTDDLSSCRVFSELPVAAQRYVQRIEEVVQVPVRWIGVGPARDATIDRGSCTANYAQQIKRGKHF